MKTIEIISLTLALIILGWILMREKLLNCEKKRLSIGMDWPAIWVFFNDSEVNSRNWSDFMARSSRVMNIPLLNLCYETIVAKNKNMYRVEAIAGLQGVAERMGGWDAMPELLRNPKARISKAEEDWIRTAILAKFGGLWLSPSVVCLRGFGELPKDMVIAFGEDEDLMYGSRTPGFRALWSPVKGHPMMLEWEARIRDRLDNQIGGRQIRGDAKSDWAELCPRFRAKAFVKQEFGRDPRTSKTLDLELIFASGTQGRLPFKIPPSAIYMPIPYNDLLNRRHFGWILRSSEEQIMESDLAIRYIIEAVHRNTLF